MTKQDIDTYLKLKGKRKKNGADDLRKESLPFGLVQFVFVCEHF